MTCSTDFFFLLLCYLLLSFMNSLKCFLWSYSVFRFSFFFFFFFFPFPSFVRVLLQLHKKQWFLPFFLDFQGAYTYGKVFCIEKVYFIFLTCGEALKFFFFFRKVKGKLMDYPVDNRIPIYSFLIIRDVA